MNTIKLGEILITESLTIEIIVANIFKDKEIINKRIPIENFYIWLNQQMDN